MESCLLCLEANKDALNCIKASTSQWTELNITKIIEKHFWPLHNVQLGSWICSPCWREVEEFHKFYLRIEEVHLIFGKIKVENLAVAFKCKEELKFDNSTKDDSEAESDNMKFCFIEPEILIDQTQLPELTEHTIFPESNPSLDKDFDKETSESSDELDNIPLKKACRLLRIQNNLKNKDPLEKSKNYKKRKQTRKQLNTLTKSSECVGAHTFKVKEEPLDLSDVNNDSDNINDNDGKEHKDKRQHLSRQKENDKFIAKHFKQMICDLCQVPFVNFSAMQRHFRKSHKRQGYVVCCKRKFFGRSRLVDHVHCHLNTDHFKCNECGKVMSDRSCLDSHLLRVHRANEIVKHYSCDLCGKSFTKAYVLRTHKLTHLAEEEKKFHCTNCGKNYGSPYLLHQHTQAVHLKRFVKVCDICGKATNSNAEFKIHMNKHEGIPLPAINCDVCGLRLTSERGLKLHKESQHPVGGKQDHQCSICLKVSPTLKTLQKHINTMHKKGYDHKCTICQKAFKRAEALREHIATHTGKALYTCPWCPKTFNSNGNMHAHRKKMHPKEWEESKLQKYSSKILPEI